MATKKTTKRAEEIVVGDLVRVTASHRSLHGIGAERSQWDDGDGYKTGEVFVVGHLEDHRVFKKGSNVHVHRGMVTRCKAVADEATTAPAETVTHYGDVHAMELDDEAGTGLVAVTVRPRADANRPLFRVYVPRDCAPSLGDVCRVTFSKPEVCK